MQVRTGIRERGRVTGRFAPSPTSDLHIGNLRTALLAWLFARSTGRKCLLRVEDLDSRRVAGAPGVARRQIDDMHALGLRFDGPVWWQSSRLSAYRAAVMSLGADVYECFCTRREIAEAASAPHHGGLRPYPGTCARLTRAERDARRATRPPALRVRAGGRAWRVRDRYVGVVSAVVDDFVLVRNDGVPAYNLAVVVDDMAQEVDQVVRADDLLMSSPRQGWLTHRLGGEVPDYVHVPLAVNEHGRRLAKRDGAVSLSRLRQHGYEPARVLAQIGASLGLVDVDEEAVTIEDLTARFDPDRLPREPWVVRPPT